MDAVMCASSQIRGRWGPLQMHPPGAPSLLRFTPHIPAAPLPPPVTMPLPPDEWGSQDISSVTMQGSHQILQLPVPFTT